MSGSWILPRACIELEVDTTLTKLTIGKRVDKQLGEQIGDLAWQELMASVDRSGMTFHSL